MNSPGSGNCQTHINCKLPQVRYYCVVIVIEIDRKVCFSTIADRKTCNMMANELSFYEKS
jgi:hypothetical protein